MFRRLPPTRYIPDGAELVDAQGTDAVVYRYAVNGILYAVAYHGRANNPDFHYRYRSEGAREKAIAEFIAARRAHAQRMQERRTQDNQPHGLEPGHILYASWGYDQTNIDWYQVTRVISPRTIEIRPILGQTVKGDGAWVGECVPLPDEFSGEATRHRVNHGTVKIDNCSRAHLWDGRPKAFSRYA